MHSNLLSHFRDLFFLLFLLPTFLHSLNHKECESLNKQALQQWNQASAYIDQVSSLGPDQRSSYISLLQQAIACCERAMSYYDQILNDIHKRRHKDEQYWQDSMKESCKESKKVCTSRLEQLRKAVQNAIASGNIEAFYGQSVQRTDAARIQEHSHPRRLDNAEEVVVSLREASKLYGEAAGLLEQILGLLASPPGADDRAALQKNLDYCRESAKRCKDEADSWPENVARQKQTLRDRLELLRQERQAFEEKGMRRSCFTVQKQMAPILQQIIDFCPEEQEAASAELALLKKSIALFEAEADAARLTESVPILSKEAFALREEERRQFFFCRGKSLLHPEAFLQTLLRPKEEGGYALYTDQFYRLLLPSDKPIPSLIVKVYARGELVHEEAIDLPQKNTPAWERFLIEEGMMLIPETRLKAKFGIDLRLSFVYSQEAPFALVAGIKGIDPDLSVSFGLEREKPMHICSFMQPLPRQLSALTKPAAPLGNQLLAGGYSFAIERNSSYSDPAGRRYAILDAFVEEMKRDPLALAQYVYNEIESVDPYLYQEDGVLHAPSIRRNPLTVFLEKRGSAWEQCMLLVYLLRQAGHDALYGIGDFALSKGAMEKLFLMRFAEEKEVKLHYPCVLFFEGESWIPLFPWLKEVQVEEGYDLYSLMPDEFAGADRFILRYLQEDERITRHIGPDGDDTLGVLFVRFVEEELRKQGLALSDVGLCQTPVKRQFTFWSRFPSPPFIGQMEIFAELNRQSRAFAGVEIQISSRENPQKRLSAYVLLESLGCTASPLWFSPLGEGKSRLHWEIDGQERFLDLGSTDRSLDIKVTSVSQTPSMVAEYGKTLSMAVGTTASLCFHFGGATGGVSSLFHDRFASEKNEEKRPHALLAYLGAAYFEKCCRTEYFLARLHKASPQTMLAFGLAKFAPGGAQKLPQVDMCWALAPLASQSAKEKDIRSLYALVTVDGSSNEHQILRDVFQDPYAVSTVKLLQLAHADHRRKGLERDGFLAFTSIRAAVADKTPEAAESFYFSHLPDLNLRELPAVSLGQWEAMKESFDPEDGFSDYAYAFTTPGAVRSFDGSYRETGTLIFHPKLFAALISNNTYVLHGGLGTPLPGSHFAAPSVSQWQLVPAANGGYTVQFIPASLSPFSAPAAAPAVTSWSPDVRQEHKPLFHTVADPVDVVTGAFYIDEADLSLPGPFPLEIRRNYNSQNPLQGLLGCGWKLSLNPVLIEQEGRRYAAEQDGTVIAYRLCSESGRWQVFPEDNPDLFNFSKKGIGSTANPFHAYIENDILYGADGSKRIFEEGLLRKWIDFAGNTLTFSYDENRLSQIESSNGAFCTLHYNPEGKVSEIYAKDGRRVSYAYDVLGDLVRVTLPNGAVISYEYDRFHRVIRETKPGGNVLENIYDDQGRVYEQRSPTGPQQEMIITALFAYGENSTVATDAAGAKTTYKVFQKQIYKITDPLGYETTQSWFIDAHSYFDPQAEAVLPYRETGGYPRSLKESVDKRGLKTCYAYDSRGNPEKIGLQGKDLTGDGKTEIVKKLSYNAQDLCIAEEALDRKTLTTYDPVLLYTPKRIEKYCGPLLTSYIDLTYNAFGLPEQEDNSGAVTVWKYDSRGFAVQKIERTGTIDSDVTTIYGYNSQGQCVRMANADTVRLDDFDIMGNCLQSRLFSHEGKLLSASYARYNLSNQVIWKQGANSENTVFIDYFAGGLPKALRRQIEDGNTAYTLYAYDERGHLIEEVDPLGHCTNRAYDLLGRPEQETKSGLSTTFSYEAGGLLASVTTPSGAKTIRLYTTNGLLKEEIYPDGTKNNFVYDFFGRPLREIKNGITWVFEYDDAARTVSRIHLDSGEKQVRQFDARGNLIRFTDAAGYSWEKAYDDLNRLVSETNPNGEKAVWRYYGIGVLCIRPNGEEVYDLYEGGRVVASQTKDAEGNVIAQTNTSYDPERSMETVVEEGRIVSTRRNSLGLPVKVERGKLLSFYEYDACGQCVASIDGEGRETRQKFDALGRLIEKQLPDGAVIRYAYDADSHIAECHLPNDLVWKASYDSMGRKCFEELRAGKSFSQSRKYTYEKGRLKEATDALGRVHSYDYDTQDRLIREHIDGWERNYSYDPRGLLATAQQSRKESVSWLAGLFWPPNEETTLVERSYDPSGRLSKELIFLNSSLIQETDQITTPSGRILQMGDHRREIVYENGRMVNTHAGNATFAYGYDWGGALVQKITPFSSATTQYNGSSLPEAVRTNYLGASFDEFLYWNDSGKLHAHVLGQQQKLFSYAASGRVQSAGSEGYAFDFGYPGTGVRTAAPASGVDSLDAFGRVASERTAGGLVSSAYDLLGQIIEQKNSQETKQFEWDPWGRLIKVTGKAFTWEASYDALGRRLETRYQPSKGSAIVTQSLYDPEKEFEEIGVRFNGKTLWKIYGPDACDAILDETGECAVLQHNGLRQLAAVITSQGVYPIEPTCSVYGPQTPAVVSRPDLVSYAQTLSWHSKGQDPTGLIWMGARYYDPQGGRFISPDPVGHPLCLDLYAYADGDPVNNFDPDGRFKSPIYWSTQPTIVGSSLMQSGIRNFNTFAAQCANTDAWTQSISYEIGSRDLPNGGMGLINGIRTDGITSMDYGLMLSRYAGGAKIDNVYNATHALPVDLVECAAGHAGVHAPPVQMLKENWNRFIATHGPDAKYLQISHSGGAIHVKNALLSVPRAVQERIISVAIAPGAIISRLWCHEAYNYMSARDFVPYLDIVGLLRHGGQLNVLQPHPDAKFWDHEFLSPTFELTLKKHINKHVEDYGDKK